MDDLMPCGTTIATREAITRSYSIPTAAMQGSPGHRTWQSVLRLILTKVTRTRARSAITSQLCQMLRVAMLRTQPHLILTRAGTSTKKTFIMYVYFPAAKDPHQPRQPQPVLQLQLQRRRQPHRLLPRPQRQQLRLLPDRRRRRDFSQRQDRVPLLGRVRRRLALNRFLIELRNLSTSV
jgi:hypothetical protein